MAQEPSLKVAVLSQLDAREAGPDPLLPPRVTLSGGPAVNPSSNTLSTTKPSASNSLSSTSSHTGSAANASDTNVSAGTTAGGAVAIVIILIIVISVITCVGACVWRCCIVKGRKKQGEASAPPVRPQNQPWDPTGYEEYYAPSSRPAYPQGPSDNQTHEQQTRNDIPLHEMNHSSSSSKNRNQDLPAPLNASRRFATIPESDAESVVGKSYDQEQQHKPKVSPRKGYFYNKPRVDDEGSGHPF